eukprot:6180043-Pleurochrysis_carterae.AAC.3
MVTTPKSVDDDMFANLHSVAWSLTLIFVKQPKWALLRHNFPIYLVSFFGTRADAHTASRFAARHDGRQRGDSGAEAQIVCSLSASDA